MRSGCWTDAGGRIVGSRFCEDTLGSARSYIGTVSMGCWWSTSSEDERRKLEFEMTMNRSKIKPPLLRTGCVKDGKGSMFCIIQEAHDPKRSSRLLPYAFLMLEKESASCWLNDQYLVLLIDRSITTVEHRDRTMSNYSNSSRKSSR
jgi:hypothetical protein